VLSTGDAEFYIYLVSLQSIPRIKSLLLKIVTVSLLLLLSSVVSHRFVKYGFIVWYNFIICVSFNTNSSVPACAHATGRHVLCSLPVLQCGSHWVSLCVTNSTRQSMNVRVS